MVELRWGVATHEGWVRALNEDSALADPPVFAVADGMGGHRGGEVASRLAIGELVPLGGRADLSREDVISAIEAAARRILARGDRDESVAGMGTTATGIALLDAAHDPLWLVVNVGDSRVYLWQEGRLHQVTEDDTVVQRYVDHGRLTREQARVHPLRHVLSQALGTTERAEIADVLLEVEAGQRFCICSDGLTEELTDPEIALLLDAVEDPQEAADSLVEAALEAGGNDNVTVVVVDVVRV